MLGDQPIVGHLRPVDEIERLAEERDGRPDRRDLVSAAADLEQDACAVDVREAGAVGDVARTFEELERHVELAECGARRRLREQRPQFELRAPPRLRSGQAVKDRQGLVVPGAVDRGLGPDDKPGGALRLLRGRARLEERLVDAEPFGQPLERSGRRPGPAALDLAHVLLRDPVPRDLGLREAPGDPELPHALADGGGGRPPRRRQFTRLEQGSRTVARRNRQVKRPGDHPKGGWVN